MSSYFQLESTRYSVVFVFKNTDDRAAEECGETSLKVFSFYVRNTIKSGASFTQLDSSVNDIRQRFNIMINRNCNPPSSQYGLQNKEFFSKCLTAHLMNQMTTIIETDGTEESKELVSFLSEFMLPAQQKLSSFDENGTVVAGLYLQVVSQFQKLPFHELILFPRSYTLIRVKTREIFKSPEYQEHMNSRSNYISSLFNSLVEEMKQEIKWYKLARFDETSSFADDTMAMLADTDFPHIVCKQRLEDLVIRAMSFISIIERRKSFLQPDQLNEIAGCFDMNGKYDTKILVYTAQIFDKTAVKKSLSMRDEIFRQMIANI